MAAPHPKADVARSLSPRPLIGFDDPPDDRVADDVGAREPADVDPLQPLEPRDRVGEARGRGDRQVDLLGVAAEDRKSTRLTPVTNAHLVCRLLLEKKKLKTQSQYRDTQ